jgi:SAM-dependent methyltransferase
VEESSAVWVDADVERIIACPVCGGERLISAYTDLTDLEEGVPGTWAMVNCKSCGSLLLDPRPTQAALPKAYGSYYTHQPPYAENAVLEGRSLLKKIGRAYLARRYSIGTQGAAWMVALTFLAWPFRQQLDYYLRHLPRGGGRLLDLGCGSGGFLQRASEAGWDVVGVEPDPAAAEVARRFSHVDVYASLDNVSGLFDMITMAHVVEHLHDPRAVIADCYNRLRPGGHLWIATPNISGVGHHLYGNSWQPLETPRHLVMPSPEALLSLLRDVGFVEARFVRRGRGSAKRLRASNERACALGRRGWMGGPLSLLIDLAASLSAYAAEELVVVATRSVR